jgi:predicted negative regulator of RcsB-dependent stress response
MTTPTRKAVRKRGKSGLIYLILILLLGMTIYFCYREFSAFRVEYEQSAAQTASDNGAEAQYIRRTMDASAWSQGELVLVNADHPYSFPDGTEP